MNSTQSVLVVGGGATGASVADNLQRLGHQGAITVVGSENHRPYDRPPLSKQLLAGTLEPESLHLHREDAWSDHGAEWILGKAAARLDAEARLVTLDDHTEIHFDQLVIATGVAPRVIPGSELDHVHVLRTLSDTLELRGELKPGVRFVIVGAGFLGLETAATARSLGLEVTVVEPTDRPLERSLGRLLSERLLDLHRSRGVEILTGVGVEELRGTGAVEAVELTDGAVLPADVVLVAIGCSPAVSWLEGSGIEIDNGIVCDEFCSVAPGIWAAGDVARWYHRTLGRHVRIEHRTNAGEQGRVVAKNILGSATPFTAVPYFWTDHYETRVQMSGVIPSGAEIEMTHDEGEAGPTVVTFSEGGRRTGGAGWNAPRQMLALRKQLTEGWWASI